MDRVRTRAFSINDVLSSAEIKELCRLTSWKSTVAIGLTWAMIAGALAAVARWPSVPVIGAALIVLGGRQVAIGVLGHEAAHRTLYKNKRVNDWVGVWLLGAWIWADLERYRVNHLKHHVVSGTLDDPDLGTVTPYPMGRGRLLVAFAKDLFLVTGLLRIASNLLTDLGFVRFSAVGDVMPVDQRGRSNRDVLAKALKHTGPAAVVTVLLFGVCAAFGHAWVGLVWVAAWMTTFSVFVRCRATQEHACVPEPDHPVNGSRTVGAPIWERLTVAPCNMNFHIEHHLVMTVPFYNLGRFHRLLVERGVLDGAPVEKSCFRTLLFVTSSAAPAAHANPPLGPSGVRPAFEPFDVNAPATATATLPAIGEQIAILARRLRGAPPAARAVEPTA